MAGHTQGCCMIHKIEQTFQLKELIIESERSVMRPMVLIVLVMSAPCDRSLLLSPTCDLTL
ncbi:uncharacterized protein DS421_3g67650 [Arachis hypogaea]|nr:uncharacterized protein DS421_3g67650 [Arachis hypogaea]